MSIEAAIGRIDQILQLQQSLLHPGSPAGGAPSAAGGAAAPGSAGTGASTNFAAMLASAQGTALGTAPGGLTGAPGLSGASGLSGVPGLSGAPGLSGIAGVSGMTGASGGTAVDASDPRVQAMVNEANSLVGKPYVWGGGHSGWAPQAGYDCSGFVSAVLHAGGYLSSPADTVSLPSQPGIEQGPGQYVTIYDRTGAGENGHVIIDIGGQFYESGGETGSWGGGGGVAKIGTPSPEYLATFDAVLHPAGL